MPSSTTRADLAQRIDTVEASYEFMLAFAARGVVITDGLAEDAQVRAYLARFEAAIDGLADAWRRAVTEEAVAPADACQEFVDVLARDASAARAALRLVLGQPAIGSQLVDNLNASQHVRALLTDVFLLDELLNPKSVRTTASDQAGA